MKLSSLSVVWTTIKTVSGTEHILPSVHSLVSSPGRDSLDWRVQLIDELPRTKRLAINEFMRRVRDPPAMNELRRYLALIRSFRKMPRLAHIIIRDGHAAGDPTATIVNGLKSAGWVTSSDRVDFWIQHGLQSYEAVEHGTTRLFRMSDDQWGEGLLAIRELILDPSCDPTADLTQATPVEPTQHPAVASLLVRTDSVINEEVKAESVPIQGPLKRKRPPIIDAKWIRSNLRTSILERRTSAVRDAIGVLHAEGWSGDLCSFTERVREHIGPGSQFISGRILLKYARPYIGDLDLRSSCAGASCSNCLSRIRLEDESDIADAVQEASKSTGLQSGDYVAEVALQKLQSRGIYKHSIDRVDRHLMRSSFSRTHRK
jgi:hypothetical protein